MRDGGHPAIAGDYRVAAAQRHAIRDEKVCLHNSFYGFVQSADSQTVKSFAAQHGHLRTRISRNNITNITVLIHTIKFYFNTCFPYKYFVKVSGQ